jgi:DNA repair protein RecO (recombination protein O)
MRIADEPAFVLHHYSYRETSLLLEVFTRLHGRLGLLAKGARRARSPLRTALIPFQPLIVSFSGRGELPTLSGAEPLASAPALGGNLLFCGLYLNELLLRLLHRHDPHERLFDSYAEALGQLSVNAHVEAVLRIFEKRLLEEIGYGLVLDHDVERGAPIQPEVIYRYQSEHGPVPNGPDREGIPVQGKSLLALAAERLEEAPVLQDAKNLLRALLARHLGGRPLLTRNLFRPARGTNALE